MRLQCGRHALDLGSPVVMGVLNVTPDSFSDGGRYFGQSQALARAQEIAEAGAAIVDVGGESTRPGAEPVPLEEELRRVIPLVGRLAESLPIPVSVDTRSPAVMREAIAAGASMINDVSALVAPGALEAVAATSAAVCLVHMQGEPRTMQNEPRYADVLNEVRTYLARRAAACEAAGIARSRIVLDPGFGFGKTLAHNLRLLAGLGAIAEEGLPVLAGLSRKRMIGELTGREIGDRVAGSVALAVIAALNGARILRAHDVAETVDALRIAAAMRAQDEAGRRA
jgi:dihydropteroate synthase